MIARFKKNISNETKDLKIDEKKVKENKKNNEAKIKKASKISRKRKVDIQDAITSEPFFYKDRAIVKQEDIVYYGKSDEKYYVKIKIEETKKSKSLKMATAVVVELLTNVDNKPTLIKKTKRETLFSAIEIGALWIDDAVANH